MAQISESVSPFTNLKSSDSSITNHRRENMWEDDRILSLKSPYGAPAYQERSEKLIEEIKLLFLSDMDDSCNDSDHDLIKRLEIVDTVECLGIDRHFQPEIKVALDYVYRCWNERGIGEGSRDSLKKDLNATALGFRALRLHRYNVSSGVLENFRDDNGQFFCGSTVEEEGAEAYNKHVRCMLSLSRASDILFPGEKVMEEAKAFTTNYLKKVLAGREATHVDESLLGEVKYALEFPWHCSVQRWEARSFIEIYGQIDSELKSNLNKKILELAKLDFNILQCTYQKELQNISRWLADSIVAPLHFYRKRYVQFYLWVLGGLSEPEFSASRIAFAKLCTLMTVLDDMYDTYGTLEQLKIFTEGARRCDASFVEGLPDYMKIAFEFWLKTSNELFAEAVKGKGQDMAVYIRKNADCWERYLGAYLQDAEWIASGHIPTFDEYVKNGEGTIGMSVLILIPIMLIGQLLPLDILEKIEFPSRFHHLLGLGCRLLDDARDFKVSKDNGDLSCIDCYLNEHPESTVEDALNHVNGLLRNGVAEMNWEFLKHDNVPLPNKKYAFNALARSTQFIYIAGDGFSTSNKAIKQQVQKIIIDPVPM